MSDTISAELRVLLSQIGSHLQRIDSHLQRIDTRLDAIDESVTKLREEVAYVKGRISSIPTFWQSFTIAFSVLIGLPVVGTIALFLLRLIGH